METQEQPAPEKVYQTTLRGRIHFRIRDLEYQLTKTKGDLALLDAHPIIEAADELNARYR